MVLLPAARVEDNRRATDAETAFLVGDRDGVDAWHAPP